MKRLNNKQGGFSLPEVLIGIFVVVGILWAAVSNYLEGGRSLAKVAQEDALLTATVNCVRSLQVGPDFDGIDTEVVVDSGCLDRFLVVDDSTANNSLVRNTYGGFLEIIVGSVAPGTNNIARIAVTGYDQDACTVLPITYGHKYAGITLGSTVAIRTPGTPLTLTDITGGSVVKSPTVAPLEVVAATVAAACTDGITNTVVFDIF